MNQNFIQKLKLLSPSFGDCCSLLEGLYAANMHTKKGIIFYIILFGSKSRHAYLFDVTPGN